MSVSFPLSFALREDNVTLKKMFIHISKIEFVVLIICSNY